MRTEDRRQKGEVKRGISAEAKKAAENMMSVLSRAELQIAVSHLLDNQKHVAPDLAAACAIAVSVYLRHGAGKGGAA